MNNKNLNCHPELLAKTCQSDALTRERHPRSQPPEATPNQVEPGDPEGSQLNCCFRSQPLEAKPNQVEPGDPEGSQPLHISPCDIAENAKLNHEIAKELRKYTPASLENKGSKFSSKLALNRKRMGLNKTLYLLTLFTLIPPLAHAETCTPTPDCKSLGYTETSCPDGGGVKCPWNTNLMYCCKKCAPSCEVKNSCQIGDILYSDKKCYTCPNAYTLPGRAPIGVVFSSGKAVALTDLNQKMSWDLAKSACRSYSVEGVSGWHLPSKDELLAMYNNRSSVVQGFSNAIGGKDFVSSWYWSSSYYGYYDSGDHYYVFDPVLDSTNDFYYDYNLYVRPVLSF